MKKFVAEDLGKLSTGMVAEAGCCQAAEFHLQFDD
jgi:hypothetical protein